MTPSPAHRHPFARALRRLLALALIAGVLVLPALPVARAAGSVWYVKPGGSGALCTDGQSWATAFSDLQVAVGCAAVNNEIWVAAGTYKPTTPAGDRSLSFILKNGVAIYGGFAGTEAQRDQRDVAANLTTLSGDLNGDDGPNFANNAENSYHVVTGGGTNNTAILDGFTISGGNANGAADPDDRGGGMYNTSSSPTLGNLTFSSNSALSGGGMFNDSSSLTLSNVTFTSNRATTGSGGGMANENGSNPTLSNVTFTSNSATNTGGGMDNFQSSPTLSNVTFSGNSTTNGGGMRNENSSPTLSNVTFAGNSANVGGGMNNAVNSNPTLSNVTFAGNSATGNGGGMLNETGSVPAIRNSILWGNTPDAIANGASTPTISYSLIQGGCPAPATCNNILTSDPKFVTPVPSPAPSTNGDLRLQLTSPAIDAGDNTVATPALPATDRDGKPRKVDLPTVADTGVGPAPIVDMGAYEQRPILYVNDTATGANHGGTWADAYTDLQDALAEALATHEIWVAQGTYKPTTPGGPRQISFTLKNGVGVYGGFAGTETQRDPRNVATNVTILSGDLDGDDSSTVTTTEPTRQENSLYVVISSANDNTAILDGFSIRSGNANGPAIAGNGGGMAIRANSRPLLRNLTFELNSAVNGGGMHNDSSSPTLSNVAFRANFAEVNGGGMFNTSSSPALTNVSFTSNRAPAGSGGGMFNQSSSNPTLREVQFTGNSAINGGGIYNFTASTPTLRGVEFKSNAVTGNGGGMYNDASAPTLTRVTFAGNTATTGSGGGMFNRAIGGPELTNVTFRGNSAINGAGVYNWTGSNPKLTNAGFSGNSSSNQGGGMLNDASSPVLTNVTFSLNQATTTTGGGGIYNQNSSSPQVRNSIFWGNSNGAIVNSDGGSTPTVIFSLVQGGYPGNIDADPLFVDADGLDNIAGTEDDNPRPQASSPALDFGDNTLLPPDSADLDGDNNTSEPLPLDLDDQPRLVDYAPVGPANRTVDLGAYELGVAHVVNVGTTATDGRYKAGQLIPIVITFSQAVTVTGTPQLTLETGASDAVVNYSSGSGTTTLTFNYTVAAGQSSADLDYASTSALALNGGTIKDAANNNADLTLHTPGAPGSLSASHAIVIDTTEVKIYLPLVRK